MIKLILSILTPVLFIANYWVCEYLFPDSDKGWGIFIEMDKTNHNIYSLTILTVLVCSLLRTKYPIGNLFLLFTVNLSVIDVMCRVYKNYNFDPVGYTLALLLAAGFSVLFYYKNQER